MTLTYGPYGEPLGQSGDAEACPFRYQSKFHDAETGLSYFGYRYYTPKMGRWISRDPLGEAGGFNLYGYCGNDPVNGWDYLGMAAVEDTAYQGIPGSGFVYRILLDEVTRKPLADDAGGTRAKIYEGRDIREFEKFGWTYWFGIREEGSEGSVKDGYKVQRKPAMQMPARWNYPGDNVNANRVWGAASDGASWTVPVAQASVFLLAPAPEDFALRATFKLAGKARILTFLSREFKFFEHAPAAAKSGLNSTKIVDGVTYELRASKGGVGPNRWFRVGASPSGSNATRLGVVRDNPADWRATRDLWDELGYGDI
ncbi:RHS repeat-associated core domain-containing protein [Verrucomicrobium spinosum]|uniref:RHS repeat-associated core domain-containing protein n=2 Tax=Verrucomicrobium spinosum TaxID=2736 RepID=UPI0001744C53|nr:RHS repeat-associated core domain-containing protein [Verrucomicrobium spinosum]